MRRYSNRRSSFRRRGRKGRSRRRVSRTYYVQRGGIRL